MTRDQRAAGWRWWRVAAAVVLSVIAGSLASALVAVLYLSRSPLDVGFLTPSIEAALSRQTGRLNVRVGATQLAWDGEEAEIELRAKEISFSATDGTELIRVPMAAVRPRLSSLLRRKLDIASLEIVEAEIRVTRNDDGTFEVAGQTLGLPAAITERGADAAEAEEGKASNLKFAALPHLELRYCAATLVDQRGIELGSAKNVELSLAPAPSGITVELRTLLTVGEESFPLATTALYTGKDEGDQVTLEFKELNPARFAAAVSGLQFLKDDLSAVRIAKLIDAPIGGKARLSVTQLQPSQLSVELGLGPGRIGPLRDSREVWDVKSAAVTAGFDFKAKRLDVRDSTLSLEAGDVRMHGSWADVGPAECSIEMAALPVDKLRGAWPATVATGARDWIVSHITAGVARQVRVDLAGETKADGRFVLGPVTGSFDFENLDVRYIDSMPAVSKLAGKGGFTNKEASFRVASGQSEGVTIGPATVRIGSLETRPARITIDAQLRGRLDGVLRVLNHEPVGLLRSTQMRPDQFEGSVNGRLKLGFPLKERVTFSELGLYANAQLDRVLVRELGPGMTLRDGKASLELDPRGYVTSGTGVLREVPIELKGRQSFPPHGSPEVVVSARLDDAARRALGLESEWLKGVAQVAGRLDSTDNAIDLTADLKEVGVDTAVDWLNKKEGTEGSVVARLHLGGGRVTAVEGFRYSAANVSISGSAQREDSGEMWRSIQGVIDPFGNGRDPRAVHLAVKAAGAKYDVRITAADAGPLIRTLTDGDATGGSLSVEGTGDLSTAGHPFQARMDVRNFTATRAPALTRIIELASIRGMVQMLSTKGLKFDSFTADISHLDSILHLRNACARGPSLAVLFDGTVNLKDRSLDWNGRLIPSYYGLNEAADKVPLVGGLLSKATGGAVHVIEFTMKGPVSAPQIRVNPLTSLAPGALRDLLRALER